MPIAGLLMAGRAVARSGLARKAARKVLGRVFSRGAGKVVAGTAVAVAAERVITTRAGGGFGGGGFGGGRLSPFEPGRGVFGRKGGAGRIQAGEMGACPSGYHLNKHPLTDGTPARAVCVRNRSINYANGRAARRAGRRLRGTVKMLKRSFSLVSGSAPKGKFIPRKK